MALTDPISVTINAVPATLPRTGFGINTGSFSNDTGTVLVKVSHSYAKRTRRLVRLDHSKIAADPLTSANTKYSMSAQFVIDTPSVGYTPVEAKQVVDGFIAFLTAASGAQLVKILGGES